MSLGRCRRVGLAPVIKRKPELWKADGFIALNNNQEDEAMKLKRMVVAAALVASTVACSAAVPSAELANEGQAEPAYQAQKNDASDANSANALDLASHSAEKTFMPTPDPDSVTIRTESYPRPPSSDATYYIYERNGQVICTKLAVCDKYGNCNSEYRAGVYKAEQDVRIGQPYDSTSPVRIPPEKLSRHVCLAKYVKDVR